ncbi:MAG TPA: secondary thiamine-phosphate synthase enzyme YjbQ [Acidimicrobiales bacterium]|nr:secondary thiamine-phosphate synthase enzyme YjbQ [Acidimicrobiales bacterium]
MKTLEIASEQAFQLIDVTDAVNEAVAVPEGVVHVWCPHTSCGLLVGELEDGFHEDLEGVLEQLAPVAGPWAHDDLARRHQNLEPDERRNGWSHIRAALATLPFVVVPVADGRMALGRWQRLFLVELDGPRPRRTLQVQSLPTA